MAKSIVQQHKRCYICRAQQCLELHHVYFGFGLRELSDQYGLTVWLCHECHNEPPNGVHQNKEIRRALQARVQAIAMKHYKWSIEDFIRLFRKNYL